MQTKVGQLEKCQINWTIIQFFITKIVFNLFGEVSCIFIAIYVGPVRAGVL